MAARRKKSGPWSALGDRKREAESVERSQAELQRALDAVDPAVAKARTLLRPTWSRPAKDALIEAFNPLQEAIRRGFLTAKTSGRELLKLPEYSGDEHIHSQARALAARHNELLIHADDVKIALSRALHGDSIAVERALDHFGVTAQRRIGTVTESTKENMMASRKPWAGPVSHPVLEQLATKEVGLNRSSLIFVSEDGTVRAVFTDRDDMDAAITFAESLPRKSAVIIEDHTGVAWENEESDRRQREEED